MPWGEAGQGRNKGRRRWGCGISVPPYCTHSIGKYIKKKRGKDRWDKLFAYFYTSIHLAVKGKTALGKNNVALKWNTGKKVLKPHLNFFRATFFRDVNSMDDAAQTNEHTPPLD